MNLEREIADYIRYCKHQKKLSKLSIKAYEIDLGQFLNYIRGLSVMEVSKASLSGYVQELHQNFKPKTAKRKLACLRTFLNHLEFEEILDSNPIRKIKTKFQEPKTLPKTIPLKFIKSLLSVAINECTDAHTKHGELSALRDLAVIEALFATGVRVSELCSLKKDDVNLDDGTLLIMGKGSKERIIQIGNGDVLNSLRKYSVKNNSSSVFFYQSVRRATV